jgi:hypothetical protein
MSLEGIDYRTESKCRIEYFNQLRLNKKNRYKGKHPNEKELVIQGRIPQDLDLSDESIYYMDDLRNTDNFEVSFIEPFDINEVVVAYGFEKTDMHCTGRIHYDIKTGQYYFVLAMSDFAYYGLKRAFRLFQEQIKSAIKENTFENLQQKHHLYTELDGCQFGSLNTRFPIGYFDKINEPNFIHEEVETIQSNLDFYKVIAIGKAGKVFAQFPMVSIGCDDLWRWKYDRLY